MKCTIFTGEWFDAQNQFNKWAKGKDLTREVLIHEQVLYNADELHHSYLAIIVYHPDTPAWNATKEPEKAVIEDKEHKTYKLEEALPLP